MSCLLGVQVQVWLSIKKSLEKYKMPVGSVEEGVGIRGIQGGGYLECNGVWICKGRVG